MKKIVFITRHDPTKIGGGSFATRAYLEALNYIYPKQVVLFVSDTYQEHVLKFESDIIITSPARPKIKAVLGIVLGKLTRFEEVVDKWLKVNYNNIETVVFDGSIIGGTYIKVFKNINCKLVTIHHNYEVEYHKENKSLETIKGNFLYWIKKLENRAYTNSDINLFLTKPDLELFKNKYGNNKSFKEILGCFEFANNNNNNNNNTTTTIIKKEKVKNNLKLVISGSLATYQTIDGVNWFLDTIYPILKEKYTNIELTITGRSPSEVLIEKCKSLNVNLIPSPLDIRKVIAQGNIYICPTRLGGGLKLRIMDALALGLPSLIHDKSFRGYENIGKSNLILPFTNHVDFLVKLDKLIVYTQSKDNVKNFIIKQYKEEFSFEAGVKRFKEIINV